ncbi:hypothetical protein M408DRAFT_331671 [Serendipita vermifera MAFF 305830]|uniref:Phosphatidylinositol-specific phospholipase C X domain-containing protein n=1 Tax=Serendipita vermifera MAFF 305830 TaxID=933852 RepID=A0A0C2X5Z1_SERVB|nr:hypothetical protein M408DRAFT_331671 [Serendipita vermifera MAFF 305830]
MDDSATIQSLSIPGTHDSLAWNVTGIAASFTKTQDLPLFKQLDAGVRFIDLRVGETNGMINLYHGAVQLDETAQLVDVFWGLYKWLDTHPTETVIVSVKVDNGNSTATLEQSIHDLVTGQDVADYWVQSTTLPTLGAARHKAILLRRFAFDLIPEATPVGIDASSGWSDNLAAFTISYSATNDLLYIEDFYNVGASDLPSAVDAKFGALSANLDLATTGSDTNQLYISFASGYSGITVTPQLLAVGNGTDVPGVNSKAISYLAGKRGSRFGVVLFDFIGSDTRLVPATLSQQVDAAALPSSASGASGASSTTTVRRNSAGPSASFSLPVKALAATLSISVASLLSVLVL